MYNLIELREVNWRRGLGGGNGGRYNRNVGAGSVTNNNNLSAEDRKHEAALGGGGTTGMNSKGKLPFNYRKVRYFDTITATKLGIARKFL